MIKSRTTIICPFCGMTHEADVEIEPDLSVDNDLITTVGLLIKRIIPVLNGPPMYVFMLPVMLNCLLSI